MIITAKSLRKVFKGKKKELVAVKDISFEVEKGEIFGFLGPNGAGKSTTIKMLTGQIIPTGGEAYVCGFDVTKNEEEMRSKIGVVPEMPNLYADLSAKANLDLFADLYGVNRERSDELLKQFGLDGRLEPVKKLSKGLAQRVLLARGLLHEPELLFLDEPTVGLDPHSARDIRDMIRGYNKKGMTIFLTTHYMEEADELCDRVAIIDGGSIVALDTPHNLKLAHSKKTVEIETTDGTKQYSFDELAPLLGLDPEKVRSIHSVEPTLQEVFIRLTGHELGDGK